MIYTQIQQVSGKVNHKLADMVAFLKRFETQYSRPKVHQSIEETNICGLG